MRKRIRKNRRFGGSNEFHTVEFFKYLDGMSFHGKAIKKAIAAGNCAEAMDKFGWLSVSRGAARDSIASLSYDYPKGLVQERLASAEKKAEAIQRTLTKKCLR